VYFIDTKSIGTELKKQSVQLKKEKRKDKDKIQELSEIIHEQNFLLQHNDQYMLELENQLEAIAAPPPEPVIPGPEGKEDVEGCRCFRPANLPRGYPR
jgi:hypothetical protein